MPRRVSVLLAALLVAPAWSQPRQWVDDFLTVTTYDSASLLAPCYGGPGTKYTVLEGFTGDIFNEHAVSGDGSLRLTSRALDLGQYPSRIALAFVGWVGLSTGCPGEPPLMTGSESFTSADLCMYGGFMFTPWHLRYPEDRSVDGTFGQDALPGIGGVDDDLDGTTDEEDESPALRPSPINGGYGDPADPESYPAGQDARPGVANVDDDGNGVTDDIGETGDPAGDAGDDRQRIFLYAYMRADLASSSAIFVNIDPGAGGGGEDAFSLRQFIGLSEIVAETANEIGPDFYTPYTQYNYAFCSSGTCFGAQLWTGGNIANPAETLGPLVNSLHDSPTATLVALAAAHDARLYLRQIAHCGNRNFSDSFWVISGDPIVFYPSVSADFDGDRDVDVQDFLTFSGCFNGALNPPTAACANGQADLDNDGDVDVNDFLSFSTCFNGALNRPRAACFPPDLTACP